MSMRSFFQPRTIVLVIPLLCISTRLRADDGPEPEYNGKPISQWLSERVPEDEFFEGRYYWGESTNQGFLAIRQFASRATPAVVRALQQRHPRERLAGFEAIRYLGPDAQDAIPVLAGMLDRSTSLQARLICESIASIGLEGVEARAALAVALLDTRSHLFPPHGAWRVSRSAAEVLRQLGPDGIQVLLAHAHDGDPVLRLDIVSTLGAARDQKSVVLPILQDLAANDPESYVRGAAVESLAELATSVTELGDVKRLVADSAEYSLRFLDSRMTVGATALVAVAQIGPQPQHLSYFQGVVDAGPEHENYWLAVETLARHSPEPSDAIVKLREGLTSEERQRPMYAAAALAETDPQAPDVIDVLARTLDTGHRWEQIIAARALGLAGDPARSAISRLRGLLKLQRAGQRDSETPLLQMSAAIALIRLGDDGEQVRAAFIGQLGDEYSDIWDDSDRELFNVHDAWTDTLAILKSQTAWRHDAAAAIARFYDDEYVPAKTIEAIGVLGDDGVVMIPRIHALLFRPETTVEARQIGLRTLGAIGRPVRYAVVDDLHHFLETGPVADRAIAARALGELGGNDAATIEKLTQALDDRFATMRVAACDALGMLELAAEPSLPRLRERESDSHAAVRDAARKAMERIGDGR